MARPGAIAPTGRAESRPLLLPALDRLLVAEPDVYGEEFADEVRQQLLVVNGVLVWVDPIHERKTRIALDRLLREVAAGPWVSAHPDVILRMGVKEVLYRTKHLGWGTGTY